MNRETFEIKLKKEYNLQSLFVFLKENCKGNSENIEVIKTEELMLNSFNYVLEHPNTDLEKYYIKEIVNIIVQMEIRTLLPFLEKCNVNLVDEQGKVVIGRVKTSQAKFFHYLLDEPICLDLNKIYVDDSEMVMSDFSVMNFEAECDTTINSFIMIGGSK
tara:strand:+ start:803 stop:1282 length:480 start_codon:yes stop_codon:yes gene_type:complete